MSNDIKSYEHMHIKPKCLNPKPVEIQWFKSSIANSKDPWFFLGNLDDSR